MKLKGVVNQIIKWEKRNSYFSLVIPNDINLKYDCIIIISEKEYARHQRPLWKRFVTGFSEPKSEFDEHTIEGTLGLGQGGMLLWVKRPHEYKEGDLVELEINCKLIGHET